MKKIFLPAVLAAVLFVTACGASDNGEEPPPPQVYTPQFHTPPPVVIAGVPIPGFVPDKRAQEEITLWHALSGTERDALRGIIEEFHDYQEYIRVVERAFASQTELHNRIMLYADTHLLPHIATATPDLITLYRFERMLLPLGLFMADPAVGISDEQIGDVFEEFRAGMVHGGEWYGLPFSKQILVMYYNHGAGVTPPATWDELERTAHDAGLSFAAGYDAVWATMLAQRGGVYINYAEGAAAFACAQGIGAMEQLTRLVGIARENNNAGLIIGYSGNIPTGSGWASAPVPAAGGIHAAEFTGCSLVLIENVSHSIDSRVGAWEFLKFTLQTEIAATWAIASGSLPATQAAAGLPRYRAHLIAEPAARGGEPSLAGGFWRTRHGYASVLRGIILEELPAIFAGDIQEGMTRAQERATEALNTLVVR